MSVSNQKKVEYSAVISMLDSTEIYYIFSKKLILNNKKLKNKMIWHTKE